MTEHIGLLAAAYAFHAGLSRQAAVAAQVRAMEEPSTVRAGEEQQQLPSKPVPPGRQGGRDPRSQRPSDLCPGRIAAWPARKAPPTSAAHLDVTTGAAQGPCLPGRNWPAAQWGGRPATLPFALQRPDLAREPPARHGRPR
jgi:hypothetical protein